MIEGAFDPASPFWPVPYVRAAVFLPGISKKWGLIDFLLDTGASGTSLHPKDARGVVGIDEDRLADPTGWADPRDSIGISGLCRYFQQPAHYAFRHDDGHWQVIEGEISIAQLLPEQNETIPSLLGWDVLQLFTLTLDWSTHRIQLV